MTRDTSSAEDFPAKPARSDLLLGFKMGADRAIGFEGKAPSRVSAMPGDYLTYSGEAHLMTVAPTGSGKGRNVVIPNLLWCKRPMVVLDPKGENYRVTARARRKMGHQVIKLDPFNLVKGDPSDSLNPLDLMGLKNTDLETASQVLAKMLSNGSSFSKDPFWDVHGCGLLSGLVAAVVATSGRGDRNLETVSSMLMEDDNIYKLAVFLDEKGKELPRMAYRELASFVSLPDLTRGGVYATAVSYLKTLLADPVLKTLRTTSFRLKDIVKGRPVDVFLILPSDKLSSHANLIRVWIGTLLGAIMSRTKIPKKRTVFMIDECAQLKSFSFLEDIVTLCRGYGLQCWTIWQDLAQLKSNYPSSWETLVGNAGVVQAFASTNLRAARQMADLMNIGAEQLFRTRGNEQMLLFPGEDAVLARRIDYLTHPLFKGTWDRNPYYAHFGRDEGRPQ